jgi:hypothetical protein
MIKPALFDNLAVFSTWVGVTKPSTIFCRIAVIISIFSRHSRPGSIHRQTSLQRACPLWAVPRSLPETPCNHHFLQLKVSWSDGKQGTPPDRSHNVSVTGIDVLESVQILNPNHVFPLYSHLLPTGREILQALRYAHAFCAMRFQVIHRDSNFFPDS